MAVFESKLHSIVINKPNKFEGDFKAFVLDFLGSYYGDITYCGCVHDKDLQHVNLDSEEFKFKTIHCHVILKFPRKYKTMSIIKDFEEYCLLQSWADATNRYSDCLSDKRIFDLNLTARYLLHLDDSDKHQYDVSELFYNDEECLDWINESENFSVEYLVKVIDNCNSFTELCSIIGLEKVNHLFKVVDTIWKERKGDKVKRRC